MIKVDAVGLRLDDAVAKIDLGQAKVVTGPQEKDRVMEVVDAYHQAIGKALADGNLATLERGYGHLKPTGEKWDGINDWREKYVNWDQLGVKSYSFTLLDPIIRISEDEATVDVHGIERYPHKGADSASGFSAVYTLEKRSGQWIIVKVDEATEGEFYRG